MPKFSDKTSQVLGSAGIEPATKKLLVCPVILILSEGHLLVYYGKLE
jgi:hypothetical protein